MTKSNNKAFTLVELIVVIVIVAILWTIAFMAFQHYTEDSRNSVKITDISLLKTSLSVYNVDNWFYPLPSNIKEIKYNSWILWYQWTFWQYTYNNVPRLNKIPIDPLNQTEYPYSVTKSRKSFQIATVIEWSLLWTDKNNYKLLDKANADYSQNYHAFVTWDFDKNAVTVNNWINCSILTSPSLLISNLPSTNELSSTWVYNFVYDKWSNFPEQYVWVIDDINYWKTFQMSQVYNECSVDSLYKLNLYIHNLSLAFQQLNWDPQFDEIIFKSYTNEYKLKVIDFLQNNWIPVSQSVINEVKHASQDFVFTDTFSWTDWDQLIWLHISDTVWTWDFVASWPSADSYLISSNKLRKNNSTSAPIYVVPFTPITSFDTTLSFKIENFWWDTIKIYSRYIDDNNYYLLTLSSWNYQIIKKVWWTQSQLVNSTDADVTTWKTYTFMLYWNNIIFSINWIEKENIVDNSISSVWKIVLDMNWNNSIIDDFELIYR